MNVCFWFVPPSLRGKENDTDYQDKLAKVSPWRIPEYLFTQYVLLFDERILNIISCPPGGTTDQGTHDETWLYDGGLSASGGSSQFFPHGHPFSPTATQRLGLLPR